MKRMCNKAQLSKSGAIYVLGQLIIWAEGTVPTPCYEARVERAPIRIYPPQYQVVACIDEGVVCPRVVTPYKKPGFFAISKKTLEAMAGVAVLHHQDGAERIPIKVIELPKEQTKLLASDELTDEGGMPFPFALGGGDVPFPFSLSGLLETGRAEDIKFLTRNEVGLHTATGYSNSFSFTEAFQDAIGNLPPDANPFPDKLTNVRVVGVGANFGGIAGLNRMYVTVASFY